MKREFDVIVERDEDGFYVGRVPELAGCHTQAKSLDKLMIRMKEAIEACVEAGSDSPRLEFVGIHRIEVTRSC